MSVFDKLVINRAAHLLPGGSPEKKFIRAIRDALREYDRATKPDGRRNNGRRVDPARVEDAVAFHKLGFSIRKSAQKASISYGALWKALQKPR